MTTKDALLLSVDCAFNKRSWHGPHLCSTLRSVTAAQASRKIANRKTIWQQLLHCIYWKQRVTNRLGAKQKLPWKGKNWLQPPTPPTQAAWKTEIARLEMIHRHFRRAAVAALSKNPSKKIQWMILGVALHDTYHAGQINGLKKSIRKK